MDSNLIFDIGMHTGQDTEFYLKKGFRVVAVDANPVLVDAAKARFAAEIADDQLVIEGIGIGPNEATLPFYVNHQRSEWSSFIKHLGSRGGGFDVIEVPVVRLNELLAKYGVPYYLKIDIEGFDIYAVKSLWASPDRPLYVSFEAVPNNLDSVATLFAQGYGLFKLINQRVFPTYQLLNPALEGRFVEHKFELGSSGPFGEESPLKWGTLAEVVTDYVKYMKFDHDDRRIEKPWWDFHCKNTRRQRPRA